MKTYVTEIGLRNEYNEVCRTALELYDALDAVEILRAHAPAARRHLLDRLETALRLADRIARQLDQEVWE